MQKERVNHYLIDLLITSKMNLPHEMLVLNRVSLEYLERIEKVFNTHTFHNSVEKYQTMLGIAGQNRRTKICRDIRQCIENLSIVPYVAEYDPSEEELKTDMLYIQMILDYNAQIKQEQSEL